MIPITLGMVIGTKISMENHFKEIKKELIELKSKPIDIPLEHSLTV